MALDPADEPTINAITDDVCDKIDQMMAEYVGAADPSTLAGYLADLKLLLFTAIQQALELNRLTQGPQT